MDGEGGRVARGSEWRMEGGREIGREGNFQGGSVRRTLASIQCTKRHTMRPSPLRIWYYKYKIVNGIKILYCDAS